MITFNGKTYSLSELRNASTIYIVENFPDKWQQDFWEFLKDWFNESLDYISVKTSGSTGNPKTIKHSKKYIIASAKMTNAFFGLDKTKTALLCLPAKAIGGMMMIVRALVSEMHLIVQKPSSNPLQNINKTIDFVAMVPMQVQKTFDENEYSWKLVKTLIIGGGEVSETLRNRIKEINLNAYSTFGMTETISHIALNEICIDAAYKALKGVELSKGEKDSLIINAPHLGVEHLETNDVVEFVAHNEFIWQGRLDNAIETGGIKLQAEIIEQKLKKFIKQAFIISSVKDLRLNNKLVLIIEGSTIDNKLFEKAFEGLDKYEKPKEIFYVEALKYVPNGKIDRNKTQALISK